MGCRRGIPRGVVEAYIEIVTTDTVKFELDKESGHLRHRSPSALLEPAAYAVRLHSARRTAATRVDSCII